MEKSNKWIIITVIIIILITIILETKGWIGLEEF